MAGSLFAQKVKNISAQYTYYATASQSIDEAKRIAIERARLQAIADEFGTLMTQSNSSVVTNQNGESNVQFFSLGGSDVKGEWLADTKEPETQISYVDNTLVITAQVWGKARETKRAEYDLSIKTLRNGIESEHFYDKDRFSVMFHSPVSGYLSIWLIDDKLQQAYCLLPYDNGNGEGREIKSRTEYQLLCTSDELYPYREETILTAETDKEFNRLVFIFSTKKFFMPQTAQGEFVPEQATQKFEKWLQKNRVKDDNMYVVQRMIDISKE